MIPLPLSKTADPADFDTWQGSRFLAEMNALPDLLRNQHPIRRWEYAMARYAIETWTCARAFQRGLSNDAPPPYPELQIADIGGAGSNFWQLLHPLTTAGIDLIDPTATADSCEGVPDTHLRVWQWDLESFAREFDPDSSEFDVLTAISVIEHVPDLGPFFAACHRLLKPGGLLFLTTDYWDQDGPDTAHFHWMRERIFNHTSWTNLVGYLLCHGWGLLGGADPTYRGPQVTVGDPATAYSVCSLALVKA